MEIALFLIGILAMLAGIILFIIALVKKKGWGVIRSFVIFGVGVILFSVSIIVGLSQPEFVSPSKTPKPEDSLPKEIVEFGKSRTSPVPFGYSLRYGNKEVTVLRVEKQLIIGEKGSWKVEGISYWEAEERKLFLIVTIQFRNIGHPDMRERFSTNNFEIVGTNGIVYKLGFFESEPETGNNLGSGELLGGGSIIGDMVREVNADDNNFLLIWSLGLRGSRYFSLEE